jgi:hypothetical protein
VTALVTRPGTYRVALHASPYWQASTGCVSAGRDGMVRLRAPDAGIIRLTFELSAAGALRALAGDSDRVCA